MHATVKQLQQLNQEKTLLCKKPILNHR